MKWLALIVSLAFGAYATTIFLDTPAALSLAAWIVIGAVAHDLVLVPLYTVFGYIALGADWALWGDNAPWRGKRGELAIPFVPLTNYLRVPAVICGLLFLVYFPLILGLSNPTYVNNTTLDIDVYLPRFLLIVAVAFAISGVLYALALRKASQGQGVSEP